MGAMLKATLLFVVAVLIGCGGGDDPLPVGPAGPAGAAGKDGANGVAGAKGEQGAIGPAGKDAAASGTRIKARWLTASDGARAFLGWLDSTTGETCAFADEQDGKTICIPPFAGNDVRPAYSDPACTKVAFLAMYAASVPALLKSGPYVSTSIKPYRYFKLDGAVAPTPCYVAGGDSGCTLISAADVSGLIVAAELPREFFVSASVTVE